MNASKTRSSGRFRKRHLAGIAALALAGAALTACGSGGSGGGSNAGGDSYQIGVQIDQSGISRSVGVPQLNGIQAAIDGVNSRGGVNGKKINLVVRDDASDSSRAVSVYRELTGQDHVSAIAGFVGSVVVPPVAQLAANDKVALLTTGAPSTLLDPANASVFSTVADLNAQGRAGLDFVKRAASDGSIPANPRVALLYYASPGGQAWYSAVKAYAKSLGLDIVAAQNSTVGAATFTSQMQAITAAKPDVIVAFDIQADIVNAAKAGKAAGLPTSTPIVDYSFASSPAALQAVSDVGFTNFYASANYDAAGSASPSAAIQQFVKDVQADGFDPNTVQLAEGYAQGLLIADTLQRCGADCPADKFLTTLAASNTDLNGFAFGPITYSATQHFGVSAVRFRHWNTSTKSFEYVGDPIKLNFGS